jgi:aspartyl-tRNA(Asn)/glutamyl-tRNA(Gln) amidotransferase subunit A
VKNAGDLLAAMAGYDQLDPASVDVPVPDYTHAFQRDTSKLRLGVPRSPYFQNLAPEVAKAVETAIVVLRKLVKTVNDTALPPASSQLLPIVGAEAYAYHAKWIAESPKLYQAVTRDRIIQLAAGVKAPAYAALCVKPTYCGGESPRHLRTWTY